MRLYSEVELVKKMGQRVEDDLSCLASRQVDWLFGSGMNVAVLPGVIEMISSSEDPLKVCSYTLAVPLSRRDGDEGG